MSDVHCRHCGEPWDAFELHSITTDSGKRVPYDRARAAFRNQGCGLWDNGYKRGICRHTPIVDKESRDHFALSNLLDWPE